VSPYDSVIFSQLTFGQVLAAMVAATAVVVALVLCRRAGPSLSNVISVVAFGAAASSLTWLSGLIGDAFQTGATWASDVVPGDPGLLSATAALYLLFGLVTAVGAIALVALLVQKLVRSHTRRRRAVLADAFRRHRAQHVGAAGEALVACELAGLGWPMLRNVILNDGGRTVEIDILLRVSDGIVALEVKSWGGFIAGTEVATYWTQYLSGGQSKLLNPAVQNLAHVRALERFVADPALRIRGFVVSAGRARFVDDIAHIPVPIAALRDVLSQHVQVALLHQARIDAAWRRLVDEARESGARRAAHGAYVAGRQSDRRGPVAAE